MGHLFSYSCRSFPFSLVNTQLKTSLLNKPNRTKKKSRLQWFTSCVFAVSFKNQTLLEKDRTVGKLFKSKN